MFADTHPFLKFVFQDWYFFWPMFFMSLAGAIVLLAIYHFFKRRQAV